MGLKTYYIDGKDFSTLEEFYDLVTRVLIPDGGWWGRNYDAFNDILHGWGTPDEGFCILWKNSDLSRERLGYPETIRYLEDELATSDSSWRKKLFQDKIDLAKQKKGQTLFDVLAEIIRRHEDIQLILE